LLQQIIFSGYKKSMRVFALRFYGLPVIYHRWSDKHKFYGRSLSLKKQPRSVSSPPGHKAKKVISKSIGVTRGIWTKCPASNDSESALMR
jgi:hypothetical protein